MQILYGRGNHLNPVDCSEKRVADSISEMTQIVLPNDTNMLGNLLGGTLMHWIDLTGAIVANRHCRKPIVTASMERIDFLAPIPLGHLVILKGKIQYVGKTSMEVAVTVFSEEPLTGGKHSHASDAILTYVAVDEIGRPAPVPKLVLASEEEERRYRKGKERKRLRSSRLQKNRDGKSA